MLYKIVKLLGAIGLFIYGTRLEMKGDVENAPSSPVNQASKWLNSIYKTKD